MKKAKGSMKRSHYQCAARELRKHADPDKAAVYRWYFKDSAGDTFLGVTVPKLRRVARQFREMPLKEIRRFMASQIHEERLVANEILRTKFHKADDAEREQIFRFYVKNKNFIRGWNSVDGSAPHIVGVYLLKRDKKLLYRLARSRRIWDRRIAIVSTLAFIRSGNVRDTLRIARLLLRDEEDLIHKATGWMLRETGKQAPAALRKFLDAFCTAMPRTMLRYAIERFPKAERAKYLQRKT